MTVPPRVWDVALTAVLLAAFVVLISFDTDQATVAALMLAFGIVIWLTFKLISRVANVLFGSRMVARIVAFGIAVAIFPELVVAPFTAAAALIHFLSQIGPAAANAFSHLDPNDPQTFTIIGSVVDGVLKAVEIPLRRMIFGFVTWVALGHVISVVIDHGAAIGAGLKSWATRAPGSVAAYCARIYSGVRNIPLTFWPTTTVVITLAIGIYLIVGAIFVIPYLRQESIPIDEMNARLKRMLDGLNRTEAQFNTRHPDKLTDLDPLESLRAFSSALPADSAPAKPAVATASVRTDGAAAPASRGADTVEFDSQVRETIAQLIMQLDQIRKATQDKWVRTHKDIWSAESRLRTNLETQFTSNISRLHDSGEQTRYLDIMRATYSSQIEDLDRDLDECADAVQEVDDTLRDVGTTTIGRVTLFKSRLATYRDDSAVDRTVIAAYTDALRRPDMVVPSVDPLCRLYASGFVATLPQRGSGFLPLAGAFNWLMATDSLDVVVIIGMLGAGLFGSAVGTFVAASMRKKGGSVGNIPLSHLIRSFAATMVVYLGLKTGVAFAAVGNPDPDPYLMLLLCFIGTVYSDDVWKWAKRKGASYWNAEGDDVAVDPGNNKPVSGMNDTTSA